MQRIVRALIGFVTGFALAATTIVFAGYLDSADEDVLDITPGEPDMAGFCARDGSDLQPIDPTSLAFGWRCAGRVDGLWRVASIDMIELCQWQYGPDATARLVSDDADGWRCIRRV